MVTRGGCRPSGTCSTSARRRPPNRVIASHVDRDLSAMMYGVVTDGTGRGAALRGPRGRRQDGHDAGLSRRLVRRLHHRLCRRGLGGQRRFLADARGDRRHAARHDLARRDDCGRKGLAGTSRWTARRQASPEDKNLMASGTPGMTSDDERLSRARASRARNSSSSEPSNSRRLASLAVRSTATR